MQDTHTLFALAQSIFSFLGGGVAATAVFAFVVHFFVNREIERQKAELNKELERLKAELSKDAETYKLSLKKQELIFNKELDAAGDFMILHRQIKPAYSVPDMEWDDACADVARRLGAIETRLESFLARHGAIIITTARELLKDCILLASWYKFDGIEEGQLFDQAKTKAGDLLTKLDTIETQLVAAVRS
jgi:hypothetical protein